MRELVGPRRQRAWGIVHDALTAELYGASTMALMDRLLRAGYSMDESREVLQEMRDARAVALESGHWVLEAREPSP